MKPSSKPLPPSPDPAPSDAAPPGIIERPDGFYWLADDELAEIGPFASYELAQADRDAAGAEAPEPGETVQEAEGELGINEWLDKETGEPAEGQSPPHLGED